MGAGRAWKCRAFVNVHSCQGRTPAHWTLGRDSKKSTFGSLCAPSPIKFHPMVDQLQGITLWLETPAPDPTLRWIPDADHPRPYQFSLDGTANSAGIPRGAGSHPPRQHPGPCPGRKICRCSSAVVNHGPGPVFSTLSKRDRAVFPDLNPPSWDPLQPTSQAAHQAIPCRQLPENSSVRLP